MSNLKFSSYLASSLLDWTVSFVKEEVVFVFFEGGKEEICFLPIVSLNNSKDSSSKYEYYGRKAKQT